MRGVPRQVFAGKLAADEFRIFGKEENAPLQFDLVWTLGNLATQKRGIHRAILPQNEEGLERAAWRQNGYESGYSCMEGALFFTWSTTWEAMRSMICDTVSISLPFCWVENGAPLISLLLPTFTSLYSTVARNSGSTL